MLLAALLLAVAPQAPEPEPGIPPGPPAPQESRYLTMLNSWKGATAVHFSATAYVKMMKNDVELNLGEIDLVMAFSKHVRGELTMSGEVGYEKERFPVDASIIGDGKQLIYLDHRNKSYAMAGGLAALTTGLQGFTPLQAWVDHDLPPYVSVEVHDSSKLKKGWTGLTVLTERSSTSLLFDEQGALRVARVAPTGKRALAQIMEYHFHSIELKNKIDVKDYARQVPENYRSIDELAETSTETTDQETTPAETPVVEEEQWQGKEAGDSKFERGLLATGSMAPDVTLTDMDGEQFKLSSLRGKTVLLNFWFYH